MHRMRSWRSLAVDKNLLRDLSWEHGDLMTITMYDSVDLSMIPGDAQAVGAYVDGKWATYTAAKAKFPKADILSIAVFAADDADCLDIETGDATPVQAAAWMLRQFTRKVARPCLYASASTMTQIITAMDAAGVSRSDLRLWSAHYTGVAHICGPQTCKLIPVAADGTQWTDQALGKNLDESLLADDFFGVKVNPVVTYSPVTSQLPTLSAGMKDSDLTHWYIRRLQAILNYVYGYPTSITGTYDAMTASSVKMLQARDGLTQDGVCGPLTWGKVISG